MCASSVPRGLPQHATSCSSHLCVPHLAQPPVYASPRWLTQPVTSCYTPSVGLPFKRLILMVGGLASLEKTVR